MFEPATKTAERADARIGELPEAVERYLRHALPAGSDVVPGVRLRMTGKIKIGCWLPFTAVQECDGRSFEWRARVGRGPLVPLEVVDRYANGTGCATGRLFGRYKLFRQADEHVRRSAAARAALEAVYAPASLLPGRGVSWRAEGEDHIVASSYLEPEQVDVHLRIDEHGALRIVSAERWGDAPDDTTRLLVRERYAYTQPWARLIVEATEAISFAMSQKMLRGIKQRAGCNTTHGHSGNQPEVITIPQLGQGPVSRMLWRFSAGSHVPLTWRVETDASSTVGPKHVSRRCQ